MQFGTETGSLVNHVATLSVQPTPKAGMGATLCFWSDRAPATIVSVDGNIMTVQEDNVARVDSNEVSEVQDYEFSRDPDGSVSHWKFFPKTKTWRHVVRNPQTNRWVLQGGPSIAIGQRQKFHDFAF